MSSHEQDQEGLLNTIRNHKQHNLYAIISHEQKLLTRLRDDDGGVGQMLLHYAIRPVFR